MSKSNYDKKYKQFKSGIITREEWIKGCEERLEKLLKENKKYLTD